MLLLVVWQPVIDGYLMLALKGSPAHHWRWRAGKQWVKAEGPNGQRIALNRFEDK
jgi:hypothetical protein